MLFYKYSIPNPDHSFKVKIKEKKTLLIKLFSEI
jgi:hypothetical protein